jgi:hypothetical protein
MSWHLNPLYLDSAPDEDPRGERVRVPHLTCAEFIAAPHNPRDVWNQSEDTPGDVCVFGNALWALDRFLDVRDDAVTPAPYLVPEEPKTASRAASHRAFGDHSACGAVLLCRSLLDHEAAFGHVNDERRVVEVTRAAMRESSGDGLENLAVQPDRVASRTKGQPVEVDRSLALFADRRHVRLATGHGRSFL